MLWPLRQRQSHLIPGPQLLSWVGSTMGIRSSLKQRTFFLALAISLTAGAANDQWSLDQLSIDIPPRDPLQLHQLTIDPPPRPQEHGSEKSQSDLLAVYRQELDALEARVNTYDPALGETLFGMANALRASGNYIDALEAYHRARHIQRVNHGIYSLAQEPMLRGMIATHQEINDLASATRDYQELLQLHARTHGDDSPRLIPVLQEISDWHLRTYTASPRPGGVYHLAASHSLLEHAIALAGSNNPDMGIHPTTLLRNLVATNYYLALHHSRFGGRTSDERFTFTTRTGPDPGPALPSREESLMLNSYRSGRMAQEQIVDIHLNNPDSTPIERAEALAQLGDWHLLFDRHHSAREAYENGWQVLEDSGTPPEDIASFFGQPRLLKPGLEGQESAMPLHYATAIFSITNRGSARNIEILEVFPETDESIAPAALNTLKSVKFRPRLENGQVVSTEQHAIRLHLEQPGVQ